MTVMNEPMRPARWYADPTGRHQYRYWNGTEWTDQVADGQVASTDGVPVAPKLNHPTADRTANPAFAVLAGLGGVVLGVGSFLDAASASAGSGTLGISVEKSYLDGDGPITLILGIAVVALAVLLVARALPRWVGWLVAGLGAVGALVALADLVDVQDSIDQIEALGGTASVGAAMWVCLVGGIVALVGGGLTALLPARGEPTR